MSNISKNNDYPYQTTSNDFFRMLQDGWYNFLVNYNQTYITITESSFDYLCKMFCDVMKPNALRMAKEYSMQLEQERKRQKRQEEFTPRYNY